MAKSTKKQFRALWLQVHKWIGLLLAILIIPISVTGAALVWHDGLEALLEPQRHGVLGPVALPPSAYADAAAAALAPDEALTALRFSADGEPVVRHWWNGWSTMLDLGNPAALDWLSAELDRLLETVRAGKSSVLVLRGEPGVGKTALLDHAVKSASGFRVLRAVGVESEVDLAFAGLQQLCGPLLDGGLECLPEPQREALNVAFGLSAGEAPGRFVVGLAALRRNRRAVVDQEDRY